MNVRLQIKALFISNLNSADVKPINQCLDGFGVISRSSGKRQHTKVRVLGHQEADDLIVCVVPCGSMSLICLNGQLKNLDEWAMRTNNKENNVAYITSLLE
jgi:hypothetical protein